MKAEIQKISHGGETHYYKVIIDDIQVGVFKFLSDHNEWRFSCSNGSKSGDQLLAIHDSLFELNGGIVETVCNHIGDTTKKAEVQ